VTDDAGNRNNVLTAPEPEPKSQAGLKLNASLEPEQRSATPIAVVAATAAEVADTAAMLDKEDEVG